MPIAKNEAESTILEWNVNKLRKSIILATFILKIALSRRILFIVYLIVFLVQHAKYCTVFDFFHGVIKFQSDDSESVENNLVYLWV